MNEFKVGEFYRVKETAKTQCSNTRNAWDNNGGKIWIKINSIKDDGKINFDIYHENKTNCIERNDDCLSTEYLINQEPIGSKISNIMGKLSLMMKKLLDADLQTLVKAGYINGNLDLTETGVKALNTVLFMANKAELTKMAQTDIDEAKKEKE